MGRGEFGGFVAATGGAILTKPAARSRQIEFIGDSWTAGYGNMSTTRDCNSTGGVDRNSNADAASARSPREGPERRLPAQRLVRHGHGAQLRRPEHRLQLPATYYDKDLQALYNSGVWQVPSTWKPQVVVIGLGINDFSTALTAGEQWSTIGALAADYRTAYQAFIDKLRTRYGTGTHIVLTYPDLSYMTTAFADSIQQIVQARNSAGDARVSSLYYNNSALGLDLLGCDWHPSQHDHQILAGALSQHLSTLPLTW